MSDFEDPDRDAQRQQKFPRRAYWNYVVRIIDGKVDADELDGPPPSRPGSTEADELLTFEQWGAEAKLAPHPSATGVGTGDSGDR